MKAFIKALEQQLTGTEVPVEPAKFFTTAAQVLTELLDKPCKIRLELFPHELGASGLWLDLGDQYLIVIEKKTRFSHQLVILGHEVGHAFAGDCGGHATDALNEFLASQLGADPVRAAARTGFAEREERRAERCGHRFKLAFGRYAEGDPSRGAMGDVGHRINQTLGRRI